ncbi:DUF4126 family protein [Rubrivirga sp. IMCC43871]|uniref:DUF4126 family protein n=1 Tax=Rubrivirga sp. IMCC43871 TaxID=3391575 RepID=UPI0039902BC9
MTTALAAALGWAAGMRSLTPPAVLARALSDARSPFARLARAPRQPAGILGSDAAAFWIPVAAAGELVADKLPVAPSRTAPLGLAGRAGSGALVGAAVAAARRQNVILPALVGAASAVVSSFAMMELRAAVGEHFGVPDSAVALAEDALAVGISVAASESV